MSCHSLHHSCPCREELMRDAVDALAEIISGINEYREDLPLYDRGILSKYVRGVPNAVSIIRRASKI